MDHSTVIESVQVPHNLTAQCIVPRERRNMHAAYPIQKFKHLLDRLVLRLGVLFLLLLLLLLLLVLVLPGAGGDGGPCGRVDPTFYVRRDLGIEKIVLNRHTKTGLWWWWWWWWWWWVGVAVLPPVMTMFCARHYLPTVIKYHRISIPHLKRAKRRHNFNPRDNALIPIPTQFYKR